MNENQLIKCSYNIALGTEKKNKSTLNEPNAEIDESKLP